MKYSIYLLSLLTIFSACSKSDSPEDNGQLDQLLKVNMINGEVIYVSPVDNNPTNNGLLWCQFCININAIPDFKTIASAVRDFNGETNTTSIINELDSGNRSTDYAAKVCANLVAYGFDDWYLPAAGELNEIYNELGPLAMGGSGQISSGYYWSSTELSGLNAWWQNFENGDLEVFVKSNKFQCRCVRK